MSAPPPSAAPVRVRVAPSPTGDPHVGTAYMALLNLIFARQRGGKFVLRIEDTDRARWVASSEQMIFDSLRWLGLDWDEGPDKGGPFAPYRQSERTALYAEAAGRLLASGHAYRCFCTPERLEAMRRQQAAAKLPPRYDRTCRALDPATVHAQCAAGQPFTIRLAVPTDGATTFRDELRGDITFEHNNLDDQVLVKSDGFPTYHLANVVDDHLMQISDVIRAEEWISSTPKHVLLYLAFGWQAPRFWHMPLLRNADKSKISKRKNPVSLIYYRQAGYLPAAMVNFLGLLGGGMPAPGGPKPEPESEKFTFANMVERFQFEQIRLGGPVFDLAKLRWLNGLYLRALSPRQFLAEVREANFSDAYLAQIAPLVQERIETLGQFFDLTDFFFLDQVAAPAAIVVPKKHTLPETIAAVSEVLAALEAAEWEHAPLEAALRAVAASLAASVIAAAATPPAASPAAPPEASPAASPTAWTAKEIFMLLRALVTGKTASPPLLESLLVLGRARTLQRLRAWLDAQAQNKSHG